MVHLLYKYLIIHKQVSLPGVGMFYLYRKPATHDFEKRVIQSPEFNIEFKAETVANDHGFFHFVSKEKGIGEADAVKYLEEFATRLKQDVRAHKTVELPQIGVLKRNATGQLNFEPANTLTTYFPPTLATHVFREDKEHKILVGDKLRTPSEMQEMLHDEKPRKNYSGDYWWIYAIILAIIAIAAIAYYYQQNGSLR